MLWRYAFPVPTWNRLKINTRLLALWLSGLVLIYVLQTVIKDLRKETGASKRVSNAPGVE